MVRLANLFFNALPILAHIRTAFDEVPTSPVKIASILVISAAAALTRRAYLSWRLLYILRFDIFLHLGFLIISFKSCIGYVNQNKSKQNYNNDKQHYKNTKSCGPRPCFWLGSHGIHFHFFSTMRVSVPATCGRFLMRSTALLMASEFAPSTSTAMS